MFITTGRLGGSVGQFDKEMGMDMCDLKVVGDRARSGDCGNISTDSSVGAISFDDVLGIMDWKFEAV